MNGQLTNFISFVAAGIVFVSCQGPKNAPNPAGMPVPVNIIAVHSQKPTFYDLYPANVTALMQVDVRPEVEGYVTGIFFTEGTHVHKGDKLYAIDDRKYLASNNQAKANVKVAEANLAQAQKDADRYQFLDQHEAIAKQVLDHSITTLDNAKSQLEAAKQDLAKTETDLGYAIIRAPFDGTIGISQVKLGNAVTTGQTVLNTISTDDPMAVDFDVNEKQIDKFIALQHHKPAPVDSIFTLLKPDNSMYNFIGDIYVIDRGVNPQTGTITVRLRFPNTNFQLRAGMSCKVRVKNTDTSMQILIPGKALVEQMGEYFVYTTKDTIIAQASPAQPNAPSLKAIQKKVVPGQVIGDMVIIKNGLQDGDNLIVDGVQKLHNGSLIKK